MIAASAQFVPAATVIIFAGTFLTRAADTIAERTGWGRLLVGSLFLAGATSLPELSVGINAVYQGMPTSRWAISSAAVSINCLSSPGSICRIGRAAECFRTPPRRTLFLRP